MDAASRQSFKTGLQKAWCCGVCVGSEASIRVGQEATPGLSLILSPLPPNTHTAGPSSGKKWYRALPAE